MPGPSLREQAYHSIYERIISNELAKGTVTSEVQLSQQLDMSRTPIRAALQQLETEGFVRIVPKHGVLILDSSAQRVGDLLELIGAMLLFAATSVQLRDAAALTNLSGELLAELVSMESGDASALCRFEYQCLHRIIALSHNEEMLSRLEQSASRLFWSSNRKRWSAPYLQDMLSCARALLHSLADPAGIRDAVFRYVHMLKLTWH
ncbi:DNA-binding GntR family transcriptional regulator [Paenibacillus taihuensis]|uniref:DNA-binding GntR family transcriptional regulator n=1 Tax=Paenibacillus taihuensis TaxID=1156355 RepID=A0A3D9Q0E1_9BACL|nr:GntR family transcriptional regulator [Paenibacillus taihuensis]REE56279.1 DNA-binding GntR family transcriptional regulator [Paenibacillus taihuensis]